MARLPPAHEMPAALQAWRLDPDPDGPFTVLVSRAVYAAADEDIPKFAGVLNVLLTVQMPVDYVCEILEGMIGNHAQFHDTVSQHRNQITEYLQRTLRSPEERGRAYWCLVDLQGQQGVLSEEQSTMFVNIALGHIGYTQADVFKMEMFDIAARQGQETKGHTRENAGAAAFLDACSHTSPEFAAQVWGVVREHFFQHIRSEDPLQRDSCILAVSAVVEGAADAFKADERRWELMQLVVGAQQDPTHLVRNIAHWACGRFFEYLKADQNARLTVLGHLVHSVRTDESALVLVSCCSALAVVMEQWNTAADSPVCSLRILESLHILLGEGRLYDEIAGNVFDVLATLVECSVPIVWEEEGALNCVAQIAYSKRDNEDLIGVVLETLGSILEKLGPRFGDQIDLAFDLCVDEEFVTEHAPIAAIEFLSVYVECLSLVMDEEQPDQILAYSLAQPFTEDEMLRSAMWGLLGDYCRHIKSIGEDHLPAIKESVCASLLNDVMTQDPHDLPFPLLSNAFYCLGQFSAIPELGASLAGMVCEPVIDKLLATIEEPNRPGGCSNLALNAALTLGCLGCCDKPCHIEALPRILPLWAGHMSRLDGKVAGEATLSVQNMGSAVAGHLACLDGLSSETLGLLLQVFVDRQTPASEPIVRHIVGIAKNQGPEFPLPKTYVQELLDSLYDLRL